jgi:pimeloyl-ACP methyl ester carboxylesterase
VRTLARLAALAALTATAACSPSQATSALDRLRPCADDDAPRDAYCGTLRVYEDRQTKQGRQIELRIVVLPALKADGQPDPVFMLAGGPGQGAAKMSRGVREIFRKLQADRDIVLVDQRGTGASHPLECDMGDDSLASFNLPQEAALEKLRTCLTGYDADPRLYTTTIAMDDLDDVRAYLGYHRIDLYGGSYGTRAALVYMRQHGDRVRAAVIDGVAPPDMRLPLFFARDAQRSLDALVADCESDDGCRTRYPHLGDRIRALVARLEKDPPRVTVTHPRTGEKGEVRIEARTVVNQIAGALYSPMASALIPALVERAEQNDFQGMLALGALGDGAGENMSVGMQLSVICAEDVPRITPDDSARESTGTIFGRYLLADRLDACAFWPRGAVDPSYYAPVTSPVPTLVMSGAIDPVTPPTWGEAVTAHLPNARHVVMPGTGHGVIGTGCGLRIMNEFIAKGAAEGLDLSCVPTVHRPPFFVTPAGPDPSRVRAAPAP